MMITATEAATVLGITPRAVRGRLARGELKGRLENGKWMVSRKDLPLDEAALAARNARADEIRQVVESALPPRTAQPARRAYHSVADMRSFQAGHALARALRTAGAPELVPACEALERGLIWLALAWHEFAPARRLDALLEARAAFSRSAALLLLGADLPLTSPTSAWVDAIEQEVLPPLAGLFRRAEGTDSRRGGRP